MHCEKLQCYLYFQIVYQIFVFIFPYFIILDHSGIKLRPLVISDPNSHFNCRSTRHHARRSPSTGCHTHASHSHASTPGSSPLHAPNVAGLLSPHRAVPTSHMGQTGSPHRLSTGGTSTTTAAAGNGSPTSQSVPTPAPALTNVGIELNEVQPGELFRRFLFAISRDPRTIIGARTR